MKNEYEVRGDTTAIVLRRRDETVLETLIDTTDLEFVNAFPGFWHASSTGAGQLYVRHGSRIRDLRQSLHRVIMNPPNSLLVDHLNGNTLDNRRANLRVANYSLNALNKHRARRDCSSFTRGVRFFNGRWYARITVAGKQRSLGGFPTSDEAHHAYLSESHQIMNQLAQALACEPAITTGHGGAS